MKDKVLELLKVNNHCVISSVNSAGTPESALVGFSEDDDLVIVIGTQKDSRKYSNISSNPQVSIVVADEEKNLEVQYEGEARIVAAEELGDRLNIHFEKLPTAGRRLSDPNQAWVKVEPHWIRFVDASTSPISYEEMRQF